MSDFYQQIREASRTFETRAEIVALYQERYPKVKQLKNGKTLEEWKSRLVTDIQPFTKDKNGNPIKRDNLNRRFETGRYKSDRVTKAQKEEYRKLGETLIEAPEGGYHITGEVYIKYSDGECEARDIDEIISGEEADALAKAAEKDLAQMIVNIYMMESPNEEEPTGSVGDCNPPMLTVEAAEAA